MAISSFTAGSAITAGDAVYLSSDGFLYPSTAVVFNKLPVIGIALDTANPGSLVRVNNDGVYAQASNLTPGDDLFLSPLEPGALVAASGFYKQLYDSPYFTAGLSRVGRCVSTSGFDVEIRPPVDITVEGYFLTETSTPASVSVILLEDGSTLLLEGSS